MPIVKLEIRGHCAILTLNQPKQRNILNAQMCREIIDLTAKVEADPQVKTLVVTGAGPAFCAGADLGDLLAAGDGNGAGLQQIYAGFLAVANCKLPTIAAVNGPAVGAGMNLALACDVRIAAQAARFDTRFLQIGIHPGGGHTWMLHRFLNWQTATSALLFGEELSAQQAVSHGLAWRAVADGELLDATLAFAARTADYGRELLIRAKTTLQQTRQMADHHDALALEYQAQVWSLQQPEARSALETMYAKIRGKTER